jgi:hypothetical protein
MPKAMLICALGAAVAWAAIAVRGMGSDPSRAAAAANTNGAPQPQDARHMETELERMRSTLARTEHRLAQLETKPMAAQAAADDDGALEPQTSPTTPEVSDAERRAFVAQTFEREARDLAWAPASDLRALLRDTLPASAAIRALDCRQTLCRLETTHPDPQSQALFVQALMFGQPGRERPYGGALFDEPAAAPDGRGVRSTTYLLRSGHDMPTPAAQN